MVKLKRLPDYTWEIPKPQGTWIVSPDKHAAPEGDHEGGVDPWAMSCLYQAAELIKPTGEIDLGDVGEWSSVSPWKYKRRKRPGMKRTLDALAADVAAVNSVLDEKDKAFASATKKVMIQGNHELWVDNMLEEWQDDLNEFGQQWEGIVAAPVPGRVLTLPEMLQLPQRKTAYVPYGDYVRLGSLFLYHGGHFGGQYHAAAHLRGLSASVMYGHHHDYQVAKTGLLGKGLHAAWCIGMLCKPRKPFMRGRPVNWSHNFAVVHVEKDGTFHVEVIEIFEGKCYVQGKKITG